ncbi:phosphotransferase [Paenibacillus apiarius]|nr:phosphotransferase [Paenibacillus apiarius]
MVKQFLPLLEQNYRFSVRGLKLLGGYYNHVYETADGAYVVKFFRFERDDPRRVLSELHWMRHLREHGVPVASPIAARNGDWTARLNEEYLRRSWREKRSIPRTNRSGTIAFSIVGARRWAGFTLRGRIISLCRTRNCLTGPMRRAHPFLLMVPSTVLVSVSSYTQAPSSADRTGNRNF